MIDKVGISLLKRKYCLQMRSCLHHAFEILNNVFPKKLGRSKFSRLECRGSAGCLFLAVVAGNFQTHSQLSSCGGGGGGGEGSS